MVRGTTSTVGLSEGAGVGGRVGDDVGFGVVGAGVLVVVGIRAVGLLVGLREGLSVGLREGLRVGNEGAWLGRLVGAFWHLVYEKKKKKK